MKSLHWLFSLILFTSLGCTTDEANYNDVSVSITTSGLNDNKLALNNTATFTAEVSGIDATSSLTFRWSLSTDRGELSDGTNVLPNPSIAESTIYCVGKTAGEEQIRVEVFDANAILLATETLDFEIVPSDINQEFPRGCFDQPKIIYQRNGTFGRVCNFDGTGDEYLNVSGGSSIGISPDGEWIAWNPYEDASDPPVGFNMHLRNCLTGEIIRLPSDIVGLEYSAYDIFPEFSRDSKTLYFIRENPGQPVVPNAGGFSDLAAYDIESGQVSYLTSLYQSEESVENFTISPVTGDIAFIIESYEDLPDGSYIINTKLSVMQPETGLITNTINLPPGRYNDGMDWSPDGNDIILGASTNDLGRGIFRINLTSGSQPLLVLPDTDPNNATNYAYCYYYAAGSRIVFGDYNDNNELKLYSVDFNGNDLHQIGEELSGALFLQGVLE
ncbi:hypothetical protein J4050_01405 [Winogradskyella sp. DF17]|uniref:WD40 repeat protein n=1 Tax=Winogradskyella pelagia TaxID=2819984 RepID=A0ABS3SY10_9FLAO|nr:hypothetical protein [Winogradskyella sp. DF17]MBO3115382.1 hypothetical protein [Winogradskyella sp. DF17]